MQNNAEFFGGLYHIKAMYIQRRDREPSWNSKHFVLILGKDEKNNKSKSHHSPRGTESANLVISKSGDLPGRDPPGLPVCECA